MHHDPCGQYVSIRIGGDTGPVHTHYGQRRQSIIQHVTCWGRLSISKLILLDFYLVLLLDFVLSYFRFYFILMDCLLNHQ